MKFFYLLVLTFSFCCFASEQDTFQAYLSTVEDSTEKVNKIINRRISQALQEANLKKGCSDGRLLDHLKYQLANANLIGINDVQDEIDQSYSIGKFKKEFKESIFKDLTWRESIALNTYGLGPVIKIKDVMIGTDKIGHFFSEGYAYFEKASYRRWNIQKALDFGSSTEAGFYGFMMSGIYSFADLSANFNGLRFWRNVSRKFDTIILDDNKIAPLFICQNDQWTQANPFKIEDYVDFAWDESINCNEYSSAEILKKIDQALIPLEQKHHVKLRCPREPDLCQKLVPKYNIYASQIMHKQCI